MKFFSQKAIATIVLLLPIGVWPATGAAEPRLKMPDGSVVAAADLPYFKNRPKVLGYLQKIVDRKLEGRMALAAAPGFCPAYSQTSWGGDDPVTRAAGRCQIKIDEQLEKFGWPSSLRPACKCSVVVKNMTVLNAGYLERGTRFSAVKLLVKNGAGAVQERDGLLEYEQNELVRQPFSLFNATKDKICTGQLEFKVGEIGKFSGECLGGNKIVDGGVSIGCPIGVFCTRHMVGNMRTSDGMLIGFTAGLKDSERREKYPDLPEKFNVKAATAPEDEEVSE